MKRFFSLLIASLIATSALAHADFDIVKVTARLPNENERVYTKRVQRELYLRKQELSLKIFWLPIDLGAKPSLNEEQLKQNNNIKTLLKNEIEPLDQIRSLFEEAVLIQKPEAVALTIQAKDQYTKALKARKKAIPSFNIETAETKEEVLKQFDYKFMQEGLTQEQFFTKHFPGPKAKDMNLEELKELYKKVEDEKLQASSEKKIGNPQ